MVLKLDIFFHNRLSNVTIDGFVIGLPSLRLMRNDDGQNTVQEQQPAVFCSAHRWYDAQI